MSERPMPSSFDEELEQLNKTSVIQRFFRKVRNEPLIPIGCILTVTAFVNAYRSMRKGDHHGAQRMFRARVYAQGFTICAIVAGGIFYGEERRKEREVWKLQYNQAEEDKRQSWLRELEARDAEDKALQERLAKRRERRAEKAAAAAAEKDAAAAAEKKEGSSVLSALGGWMGGGSGSAKKEEPKAEGVEDAEADPLTTPAVPSPKKERKATSSFDTLGDLLNKKGTPGEEANK